MVPSHPSQTSSLGRSNRDVSRGNRVADPRGRTAAHSTSALSLSMPSELGYLQVYRTHRRKPSSPLSTPSPGLPRTPSEGPSPVDPLTTDNLEVPKKPFARSQSPSGDSVSTASPATTPRCHAFPQQVVTSKANKRASVDRRLSELKSLVASFNFDEALPSTEKEALGDGRLGLLQTCWLPEDPADESQTATELSLGQPFEYLQPTRPRRESRNLVRKPSSSSIPRIPPTPPVASKVLQPKHRFQDLQSASLSRRPQSAILRSQHAALRHARSASDMRAPPPPLALQRTESFPVATIGYSSIAMTASGRCSSSSWRSTFATQRDFATFVATHSHDEVARQEVIWELCETERSFVNDMRMLVKVFAKPLQTPQGRWMEGIPMQFADAFAAVGDIAAVHGNLESALQALRARSGSVVSTDKLTDTLRAQVPELHIHEWLLVHFAEITAQVDLMVQDASSVHGEFIRMQLGVVDCKAQSLGDLLHKPMQRLMKYPLFLSRLLEMTPKRTPTHLGLSKLRSSLDQVISSLQHAKATHEDHCTLRTLESKIQGLPSSFRLAQPGRRILLDCEAQRMQISASEIESVSRAPSRRSIVSNASSFACATSRHSRSSSVASSSISRSPSMASSRSGGSWADFRASNGVTKTSAFRLIVLDDAVLVLKVKRERSLFTRRGSSKLEMQDVVPETGVTQVVDVDEIAGQSGSPSALLVSLLPFGAESSTGPTLIKLGASQRTPLSTIRAALERTVPPLPSPVYMTHQNPTPESNWGASRALGQAQTQCPVVA